jgi:hypothetical protein
VRKLNDEEFLAARDVDFSEEAVITDDPVFPPEAITQDARIELAEYAPARQRIRTTSSGPFFLASSEKLTPELRITLDGKPVRAIRTNMMFAGVTVPAGGHEVIFERRIGRGWWAGAVVAVALLVAITVMELAPYVTSARRR